MNFVVILAISLVVMIVIIGIFTGRSRDGNRALQSCEARGGECVIENDGNPCVPPDYRANLGKSPCSNYDEDEGRTYVCCLKVFDLD